MQRPVRLGVLIVLGGILAAACGRAAPERATAPTPTAGPTDAVSPAPTASPEVSESPPAGDVTPIQIIAGEVFEPSGTAECGEFTVEWSAPAGKLPADATLVVSDADGTPVLEVTKRATPGRFLQINPLWCGDLLGDGGMVIGYHLFTGGAHCCFTAEAFELGEKPRRILEADLGNAERLMPEELDGAPPLELVSLSDLFAYFDALAFAFSPFLPLVFAYDGERYAEATRPDHVRADLEEALVSLDQALQGRPSFELVAGHALRAFADYVLLGEAAEGLADLRARVPERVAAWLDRHAARAEALVNRSFSR